MYLPSGFLLKTIINSKTSLKFARPPVITLVKSFSVSNQVFTEQKFAVVSLYHLDTIDQVDRVTVRMRRWLQKARATGRFQINRNGVNCQLCFPSVNTVDSFTSVLGDSLGLERDKLRLKVRDVHEISGNFTISDN